MYSIEKKGETSTRNHASGVVPVSSPGHNINSRFCDTNGRDDSRDIVPANLVYLFAGGLVLMLSRDYDFVNTLSQNVFLCE